MNKVKYAAIIVVYNKSIEKSITCDSLKNISGFDVEIVVVDNSESDFGNNEVSKDRGYTYISMHGNKGLSRAYNVAIDRTVSDVIVLFDDDTCVSEHYFEVLDNAVQIYQDVDVFAPVVYGQDGVIYSPNEFNFLRNKFIRCAEQKISQNKFNAIASCLAIRRTVFVDYRFNETLFVDQVDQYFFCEQRKLKRKFLKLDVAIHQNFYQRGSTLDSADAWKRMRLRLIDIARHAKLMGGIYRILGFIKCCGLSFQISKKSHSAEVLIKGIMLSCRLLFSIPDSL